MSVFADAQVQILLADYANVDASNKLNVIGGEVSFVGQVDSGLSTPFTVVVSVSVPLKHVNSSYALTVELHDITLGRVVAVPGPDGEAQALRAQQVVTVSSLQLPPGLAVPTDAMQTQTMVMTFSGLPLPAGHSFEFRAQIDGQSQGWFRRFHVLGAAPGVVFGGPANPSTIPGIGEFVVKPPDEPTSN
jgi:hypothetical protein